MAGATFNPVAFAAGLVGPARDAVRPFLARAGREAKEILAAFDELEFDTARTLDAIPKAKDDAERDRLKNDLAKFLPARRDAIIALVLAKLGTDAQGAAEAALNVIVKIGIAAARAFI